jgi:hypothetical protein
VVSPSHFEFSITSDQQCIPEEYYTRTEYCTTQLHVKALVSGVLLIKDVFLATEGLSKLDQYIFQKAFDSLFGNIGITSTVRSEDSSDGLLISFTIGVPVVYYGYENTLFNGPHLTYLKAHDDLLNSFHVNLFSALLDNQIHAALNQQQQRGGGMDDYGECHLKSHGTISLLALKEDGWDNEMPYGDTIEPITFFPRASDDDKMMTAVTFLSSFQTGLFTFLAVVLVGGTILSLFIYSSSFSTSSPSSSHPFNGYFNTKVRFTPSSSRGSVDYEVIPTPSGDLEASLEKNVKKATSSSQTSSTSKTSSTSTSWTLSSKSRFVPSSTVTGSRKMKQKREDLFVEDKDDDDDEEEEEEISEDVLSLIIEAASQQSSQQMKKSKRNDNRQQHQRTSSRSSQKSSVRPSRFIRSTRSAGHDKVENVEIDSLIKFLQNYR